MHKSKIFAQQPAAILLIFEKKRSFVFQLLFSAIRTRNPNSHRALGTRNKKEEAACCVVIMLHNTRNTSKKATDSTSLVLMAQRATSNKAEFAGTGACAEVTLATSLVKLVNIFTWCCCCVFV